MTRSAEREAEQRCVEQLDAADPLRALRDDFHLPQRPSGEPLVYLCGHSLGPMPKRASAVVEEELEAWKQLGVQGHFTHHRPHRRPWLSYHERFATSLAMLAGALPDEVVAMNSLTVNLHLLLASFYRPTRERYKILIEAGAFPSDRYAVHSQIRWHGLDPATALLEAKPREGERCIRHDDLCELVDREGPKIAVALVPGVQYLTGQCFELTGIAAAGRRRGCVVGVDLAHAIGNVTLALHDSEVDFAVWCGYKYLNGGPGAIGGAFVHERHARRVDLPRLAGWWGHDKTSRFAMPQDFVPLPGAEGWQVSNPPILSAAPLLASLELFTRTGMAALRAKSTELVRYLDEQLRRLSAQVDVITPPDTDARGNQLSLRLKTAPQHARAIHDQLAQRGVLCDWREPDTLRVSLCPLFNTYKEAWTLIDTLRELLP